MKGDRKYLSSNKSKRKQKKEVPFEPLSPSERKPPIPCAKTFTPKTAYNRKKKYKDMKSKLEQEKEE